MADAMEAGAAKVDITPPLGTPLNGNIARLGRGALAVHDPVSARCLYLSDGATSLFWVTADLCFFTPDLRAKVLELAPREVPPENIILSATHNHSGPGGLTRALVFRPVSGRYMPEQVDRIGTAIAGAMRSAFESRKYAVLGYALGEQRDLTLNRRVPNGLTDSQFAVIRLNDAEGKPIAILANIAAHPTTVNEVSDLLTISADYPGYFYTELESLAGEGCVALFTVGAAGNQDIATFGLTGWARTEAAGKAVARRAKEIADTIKCGDAKLRVLSSAPEWPASMVGDLLPGNPVLQTVEINDLAINFAPGEFLTEVGKDLRKRALDRGYSGQITVGATNGYFGYFVPEEYYAKPCYETSMNFFGPCISEWFGREFGAIMTRGVKDDLARPPEAEAETKDGRHIVFSGTPYAIGWQRGKTFQKEIGGRYRDRILAPIESGEWLPANSYWDYATPYLRKKFAAPFLGMGLRSFLAGASPALFAEIDGVAAGSGLPFDAAWMVQCTPCLATQPRLEKFFKGFFCTMFASTGERAGTDGLLVARNFDWDEENVKGETENLPWVMEVRPKEGHAFLHIGLPWSAGVFSGMNDAGLVMCAERAPELGHPSEGEPVEFVLREALQFESNFAGALKRLEALPHLRGYRVLVADPAIPDAAIVEYAASVNVRKPVKGFLLAADPANEALAPETQARYAAVAKAFEAERIISPAKMRAVLGGKETGVWNENTRYGVLFEPKARAVRVALATESGEPGEFQRYSLKGGQP